MDRNAFTEREVRQKLEQLGYKNVPEEKMHVFLRDLGELIEYENAKSYSYSSNSTEDEYKTNSNSSYEQLETERRKLSSKSVYLPDRKLNKENISHNQDPLLGQFLSPSSMQSSNSSYSTCNTSTSSCYKRKVARKRNGKFHIFDETITENETDASDITVLEERLQALPLKDNQNDNDTLDVYSDENDDQGSSISEDVITAKQFLPSYIRTSAVQPHLRRVKKTDPVNRYHQFKEEWKVNMVPGESKHNSLRWHVREQMLSCEQFERPRHTHRPNKYQVPTEKKRQALRWEVRSALAKI